MKSLYDELVEINAELDHHESDLYVKVTPEVRKIVKEYKKAHPVSVYSFVWENALWFDIPFYYQPYWDAVEKLNKEVRHA